jgi:DNA uptake protein ComE-like DNA-binding protein
MTLPGMSSRRANAILRERQKRGAFTHAAELAEVHGMTGAYVRRIEDLIEFK